MTTRSPFPTYAFLVEVDGMTMAEFSECSGLEMTVKFDEVREGGENNFVHKLPGRVEYGNLILKRGYARGTQLLAWCMELTRMRLTRRKVAVHLIDRASGTPVAQWVFDAAYPIKWSGPSFKAGENAIAVESLELAHKGLVAIR